MESSTESCKGIGLYSEETGSFCKVLKRELTYSNLQIIRITLDAILRRNSKNRGR